MEINVYKKGVLVRRQVTVKSGSIGSSRGNVSGFSLASRRRMREFLLCRSVQGAMLYGVTLTIPSPLDELKSEEEIRAKREKIFLKFRVSLQRFFVYFKRRFPTAACVWRIEIQQNGMPHLHIVSYHFESVSTSDYLSLWFSCITGVFSIPNLLSFSRYGVKVDLLDGNIAAFRYVCDHGSKHKRSQLGWIGRQWGVLNRSRFSDSTSTCYSIPDKLVPRFLRDISRSVSARVRCPCVFGSKIYRRKVLFKISYVSSSTVLKWLGYYGLIDKKVSNLPVNIDNSIHDINS